MKIKIVNVDAVGSGDDCEVYVTVTCDEQAKDLFLNYFSEIKKAMIK